MIKSKAVFRGGYLCAINTTGRPSGGGKLFLALQDGTIFRGYSVGAPADILGEVVFNTGMTGYQEILSDPSYTGQLVALTCPEIGNYGMAAEDMESACLRANGLILHEMNEPSNWRAADTLAGALRAGGMPALAGVDTRALTAHLRRHGTLRGFLCVTGTVSKKQPRARRKPGKDWTARITRRGLPAPRHTPGMPMARSVPDGAGAGRCRRRI